MKKTLIMVAAVLAIAGCQYNATGPEAANDFDSGTRDILFTVTGSMRECAFVSYTNSDSTSVVITNCMVPFSASVTIPAGTMVHITATKRTPEGNLTVIAFENGESIGYDVALDGDMEAQWIEW